MRVHDKQYTMAYTIAESRTIEEESVSHVVVSALADLLDSEPQSIEPLYHAVDPDALNSLFDSDAPERIPNRITFSHCDCDVVVSADGTVRVSNPDGEITRQWQ